MAINFTNNIESLTTTATRASRAKHFMEYTSKKKLQEANVLTEEQYKTVADITGIFNIAIHNDKRYVAVTIYRASSDPKYSFVIVDLNTKQVATAPSIKEAKKAILEQVKEDAANAGAQESQQEEQAAPTEEPKPEAAEEPADPQATEEPKPAEEPKTGKRGGRKSADK